MKSSRYDRILRGMLWATGIVVVLFLFSILSFPGGRDIELGSGPKVGVVDIEGVIMESRQINRQIDRFARRGDIKAILIRVNSPGGTVAASQEIFAKIRTVREAGEKPVVVSMGTVAASGGLYVALAGDTIMANPGTTTGSIGVILDYPVAADLLEKLGLQVEVIKSGPLKDTGSPFRHSTEQDRQALQGVIDDLYDQFVQVVAEERELEPAEARRLATGEVFSGRQAYHLGLVDLLGTYEDALNLAGQLSGSFERPVEVKPAQRRRSWIMDLISGRQGSPVTWTPVKVPQYRMQ